MNFSVISYNTLFNKAVNELSETLNKHYPDIICLQEVLSEEQNYKKIEKFGYRLADSSNSFVRFGKIYGVATFYNEKIITFKKSLPINLNTNISEYFFYIIRVLLGYNQPKTILKTDFIHKKTGKSFSVCNVHLYVIGTNELRVNHLNYALKSISLKDDHSLIVCGDFNYFPYRRKKLEKIMEKFYLVEATKNIRQTMTLVDKKISQHFSRLQRFFMPIFNRFLVKRIKTDYVFYRGLKHLKTDRLEDRHSDHYPILSKFSI